MRVAEIQIERYGVWRNLNMPLGAQGLTPFYGPNEAGKSTLMRFLRGVLYGYAPTQAGDQEARLQMPIAGSLRIEDSGESFRMHRVAAGAERGEIALTGIDPASPVGERIEDMLKRVNERVFERVFAVGLQELQELGTLADSDVAQHIYGLTLGPEGERLLSARRHLDQSQQKLVDSASQRGELLELWDRYDALQVQLRDVRRLRPQYAALCERRDRLESEIADLKQRQAGTQAQLRGHLFVERAWGPWNRIQECEQELSGIPEIKGFPEQGLEKLDKLEGDLAAAAERRDKLLGEVRQLRKQLQQLRRDPEVVKHAGAMQGYVDQKSWLLDLQTRMAKSQSEVEDLELSLEAEREHLGAEWTAARLENIDISPAAHHRLAGMARSYQLARSRYKALCAKCQRLAKAWRTQQAASAERVAALPGGSLDEALTLEQRKLEQLKKLAQLKLFETELEDRHAGIQDHIDRIEPRLVLPKWIYAVLTVFCLTGLVLGVSGAVTGLTHSGIAGAIYALLGVTCAGLAWGIKVQFEGDARHRRDELKGELAENLKELESVQGAIDRILGAVQTKPASAAGSAAKLAPQKTETQKTETPKAAAQKTAPTASEKPALSTSKSQPVAQKKSGEAGSAVVERGAGKPAAAAPSRTLWKRHRTPKERLHLALLRARESQRQLVEYVKSIPEKWRTMILASRQAVVVRVTAPHADDDQTDGEPNESVLSEVELIQASMQRIAELEQISQTRQHLARLRRSWGASRNKLKIGKREVGTSRHAWHELLAQIGLPETGADEAFALWARLVDFGEQQRRLDTARGQLSQLRGFWNAYQQRIEELGHRLQVWDANYATPLKVLDVWESQLSDLARKTRTRRDLRKQIIGRRREAAEFQTQVEELKVRRSAWLVQGGAADRDEFEQRARWAARRTFLEDQRDDAERDLDRVCEGHQDLALVEEDLATYDARENSACIDTLHNEAGDLERDLAQSYERLGGVKHELDVLRADRQGTECRFEREQVLHRLREAATEWFSLELASQSVEELRSQFERTCQPATLLRASHYLERLTCGKYRNVWTPLGKRHLLIDDEHEQSLPVECLSHGTREQLFLAIRLAIVEDLSRHGISLPMVLDDVIVNFDARRAESAIELLLEFAAQGHQVLFFTCHQHLAQMFQEKGVTPIWLPNHSPAQEETVEHRWAG